MRKMLNEIETKETTGFFVTFLSLVAFLLEGPKPPSPQLKCHSLIQELPAKKGTKCN